MKIFTLLSLYVLCIAVVNASIIYVPADQPTIQAGIDVASDGDIVTVAPGTYNESLNFGGRLIIVKSDNGPLVTFITNDDDIDLVLFNSGETTEAVLDGFRLEGGRIAIRCENSAPTIKNNIMSNQRVTNWAAIALSGPGYPGSATTGPSPAVIVNNTIVGCANGGLSTFSTVIPIIKNNIFANNSAYGLHREGYQPGVKQPDLSYNNFYNNDLNYINIVDSGEGTISADPLFNPDYSLQLESPCIDAGDPDNSYIDPDYTRNDIGALSFCQDTSDTDGDGISFCDDNCPYDYNPGQENSDGDRIGDICDNCPDNYNPGQEDLDNDGVGDACDDDDDGDGINDENDNCSLLFNPDQEDGDLDLFGDLCDNCPEIFNPDQEDIDSDGIGDSCDQCTDTDGDGYGNPGYPDNTCEDDNCPDIYNPDQIDSDGDGVGDSCEMSNCGDIDNDGTVLGITDLVYFVNYLFMGGPPPLYLQSANIGGCAGIDIHDLAWLILYMFSGSVLPSCDDVEECSPLSGGAISLDHVDGLFSNDVILTDEIITFHVRMTNNVGSLIFGITNGFRVYSPTGAIWGSTVVDTTISDLESYFDLIHVINNYSISGSGADTVGIGYCCLFLTGMPDGFSDITHTITIGPIAHEYSGGTICLDSCWYQPSNSWMWERGGYDPYAPSWDGPHCFTIYNCCVQRGDVDDNGEGPDIADLIYLTNFMFLGGPSPACLMTCDIDGSGNGSDVVDLVYLVNYMFQDGPEPVQCP